MSVPDFKNRSVPICSLRPLQDLQQWLGAPLAEQLREAAATNSASRPARVQTARQVPVQAQLGEGAVLDALLQAADTQSADLLVVGARGAAFLRRWVLGSTAERLLRRTARPVLVVRQVAHEPYRPALLAVDFSPWSAGVVALARQVAPHAHWVLFHAYQVPFEEKLRFAGVDAATVDLYRRQARAQAGQSLHALAQQAGLKPGQWEACIVEGDASLRLVEQEQERGCDLVVIVKHGQSAAEDLLLGSTTKHLLAEGTADVLVATRPSAPGPARARGPRRLEPRRRSRVPRDPNPQETPKQIQLNTDNHVQGADSLGDFDSG